MSKAVYIQDEFGNQIPLLDANGNLSMQVIMLYAEDKLTSADRKTVDAFAAEDEMSRDALDGFLLTGSAAKTRHTLGELNSEIQKLSGAKAAATLLPKEESTFSYQKLAAAVALIVVVGTGSWFIAQQFGKEELADSVPVKEEPPVEEVAEQENLIDDLEADSVAVVETVADRTAVVEDIELETEMKKLEEAAPPKPKQTVVSEKQKSPVETEAIVADEKNQQLATDKAKKPEIQKEQEIVEAEADLEELAGAGLVNNELVETKKSKEKAERKAEEQAYLAREEQAARYAVAEDDKSDREMAAENQRSQPSADSTQPMNSSAKYPGGDLKMYKFIERKKNYTEAMKNQGMAGAVTITFDIERDGRVTNINVKNGVNGLLDADAVRVVRSMPNWAPAYENGEPVKSSRSVVVKYGSKNQ